MLSLDYFRGHYPTAFEGVAEAFIGLAFYLSLFHGLIMFFRYKSSPESGNWRLRPYDALEISNKLVSSTFAIFTCACAVKVFGECGDDLVHERHNLLRHYMCFAVFYFIYDTYAMFVVFAESRDAKADANQVNGRPDGDVAVIVKQSVIETFFLFLKARPLMIAHHMVLPIILFPIFMTFETGLGDCLLSIGFVMEASTPFVSARKILSVIGLKRSLLYCLNGALMTIIFFCCRVLIFPIIYHMYARQLGVSYLEAVIQHVPWFCTVSTILIWLPQVYWFGLMWSGCIKVIQGSTTQKKD